MGKIANNRAESKSAHGVIPTAPEEILNATQVAGLLGVTLQVLRRYDIPRHLVGRNCIYFRSDVHDFVRRCPQRGNDNQKFDW